VTPEANPIIILLAEDDEDDHLLITEALGESRVVNEVRWVKDGEELMDYLHRRGAYARAEDSPRPGLILLDLNMPRKDGRQALAEIKADSSLRRIPVVVLTTSGTEEDILKSYDLGVNSYIRKPDGFNRFVEVMQGLGSYWFQIVELPPEE
jgi:CheY-like chemotaxis protein